MKYLFIVRHGDYGTDLNLNGSGKKQVQDIGMAMKGKSGPPYKIMSSPAPRAKQSADILGQMLGSETVELVPYLWSGVGCGPAGFDEHDPQAASKLAGLVKEGREVRSLVMVTHSEVCGAFTGGRFGGIDASMFHLARGQALYYDMENKNVERLP